MKSEIEIFTRINELKANILIIEKRTREELEKNYRERDDRLLNFLDKERSVWEYALKQIEWVFQESI
jgi:hypothetical protein